MRETSLEAGAEKARSSTGRKWAIGCGIGCLVLLILGGILGALGVWGAKKLLKQVNDWAGAYEDQGYTKVVGHALDVHEPLEERKVFVGQIVRIYGDCATDVAIIAQMAEIHSRVKGDLSFRGQMLTLQPTAVIEGDIIAEAQVVQANRATVLGEITGSHQLMDNGLKRQLE